MFTPIISKAVSTLNNRPALKYVYQNPTNGEFVASDGKIMLIERSGAIPMFEYWFPDTREPVLTSDDLSYPDYENVLTDVKKQATIHVNRPVIDNNIVIFNNKFFTSLEYFNIVREFLGANMVIKISEFITNKVLYFSNADSTREAVVMSWPINWSNFKVLDINGDTVGEFKTYNDAVNVKELIGEGFIF